MKVVRNFSEALTSLERAKQLGELGLEEQLAFCRDSRLAPGYAPPCWACGVRRGRILPPTGPRVTIPPALSRAPMLPHQQTNIVIEKPFLPGRHS
jgi:hypothetical protein